MMLKTLLFLLFVGYSYSIKLYGAANYITGDQTTVRTAVVEVDTTSGNFTPIAQNMIYFSPFGQLEQVTGSKSAFDVKNEILYYADNLYPFVYAADVKGKKMLTPFSSNAGEIQGVEYDSEKEQLLVAGLYADPSTNDLSFELVVFPLSNTEEAVSNFNLTALFPDSNGGFMAGGALDSKNQIYYTIYNSGESQQGVGIIELESNTSKSAPLDCGEYNAGFLTFDPIRDLFIAMGPNANGTDYALLMIDSSTFACKALPFNSLPFFPIEMQYDATTQIIYLYGTESPLSLFAYFDITTNTLSSPVTLQDSLFAFAISY